MVKQSIFIGVWVIDQNFCSQKSVVERGPACLIKKRASCRRRSVLWNSRKKSIARDQEAIVDIRTRVVVLVCCMVCIKIFLFLGEIRFLCVILLCINSIVA